MSCAVIQLAASSGLVTNIIEADATKDFPPALGTILVNLPDGVNVEANWTWDSVAGFIAPPNQPAPIEPAPVTSGRLATPAP